MNGEEFNVICDSVGNGMKQILVEFNLLLQAVEDEHGGSDPSCNICKAVIRSRYVLNK